MKKVDQPWDWPTNAADRAGSPVTLFEKFFNEEVVELLVAETKRYAVTKGQHQFSFSDADLKKFVAILLLSGYVELPRRHLYWEQSLDTHNDAVASLMSRNEFSKVAEMLHCADNANLRPGKFAKVMPLVDAVNASCLREFRPEQIVSIDESMIPYFGRHSAKQYIRGKPTKFGYKIWTAATTLGYVIKILPYEGAGDYDKSLGLGGSVVSSLCDALPKRDGCIYHIVFDNFFTSLTLLKDLRSKGLNATGTLRQNRAMSAPLKEVKVMEKEQRGSFDVVADNSVPIAITRWKDNKVVTVASTCAGAEPLTNCSRFSQSEKKRVPITLPNSIRQYNAGMGGVDRFDQNVACYSINHRTKKWWWAVFRYCVDLCKHCFFSVIYNLSSNVGGRVQPHILFDSTASQFQ